MALSVLNVTGVTGNTASGGQTSTTPSWTSTSGSLILVVAHYYNTSGANANGDVTDSKGNTYTLLTPDQLGGGNATGTAVYINNAGTRGASHTVSCNRVNDSGSLNNIAVIEFAGQHATTPTQTAAQAVSTDTTSPYAVTAAAALSAGAAGVFGSVLDTGANTAWTNPTGYTDIYEEPDGSNFLVSGAWYKLSESGTPTVSASSSHSPTGAANIFVAVLPASSDVTGTVAVTLANVTSTAAGTVPPKITKIADRGSTGGGTGTSEASTAVTMAAAGSIAVGNYLVARVAADNAGTNGAAVTLTITDPRSNTWTIGTPGNADPGAANAGVSNWICYCKVVNAYTNNDAITFNWSTSLTAKAIVIEEWNRIRAVSPVVVAQTTANGASTFTGTGISRTPTAAKQVVYATLGEEGPSSDSYTEDSDTTDGSWTTLTAAGGTNATATNNVKVVGAYKLVTGTSAQTWNATITSRDWAAVALVFDFAREGTVAVTLANTTSAAAGAKTHVGTVARTLANVTCAADGTVGQNGETGTVAVTLANTTSAATGTSTHVGTVARTLANTTSTAAGKSTHVGTLARTLANVTSTASGAVGSGRFVDAVSANGRYLLDQLGDPLFIQGSSPQDMVPVYTPTQVSTFFTDQAARGINAVQIHAISGRNAGGDNYNGDPPFTTMADLAGSDASTVRYWNHIDYILDTAEAAGCTVFLTVIDNITLASTVPNMSDAECVAFGEFLGARYASRPNLVWVIGNDWQPGQWSAGEAKYRKVIEGIRNEGDTHLLTVWLNYTTSVSTDLVDVGGYTAWESLIDINAVYDYALPYHPTEVAYARSGSGDPRPILGFEWNYEGVHYHTEFGQSNTTRLTVRRDAWWCVTSGAAGQFFGQDNVIPANEALDLSSGALGSGYATDNAIIAEVMTAYDRWQDLVPDTGSAFVTAGRGTHNTADNTDPLDNNYVTAAITADGMLAVVYLSNWSSSGTATIDVAGQISGTATITRIDPTSGATTTDSAPYSSPGNNAAGDPDWVLVFEGTNPIEGTVARTLANVTSTASGRSTHVGTVARTLANVTSSAAGTATHTGAVARTLANVTSTAAGTSTHTGTVARTLANVTSTAAGTSTHTGTLAQTLANVTSNASGRSTHVGTVARTLASTTSAAAGTATHVGTLARTLANVTSNASGSTGSDKVGTVAVTLANVTSTAAGTATHVGTTSVVLAPSVATGAGSATHVGSLARTLASVSSVATGRVTRTGSVAAILAPVTCVATGGGTITGSVNRTLANTTAAAVGTKGHSGTLAVTLANVTCQAGSNRRYAARAGAGRLRPTSRATSTLRASSGTATLGP